MEFERIDKKYPGRVYEFDLVGEVNFEDPKYFARLAELRKGAEKRGFKFEDGRPYYLPFGEAVQLAKEFQRHDPTNPKRPFARELRIACAEKLGLQSDEEMERIKIYTGVGGEGESKISPADLYHGADFFISFTDKNGKEYIIVFDITKKEEKAKKPSVDVTVGDDVPDSSDENFDKRIVEVTDNYANQFFEALQTKAEKGKQLQE